MAFSDLNAIALRFPNRFLRCDRGFAPWLSTVTALRLLATTASNREVLAIRSGPTSSKFPKWLLNRCSTHYNGSDNTFTDRDRFFWRSFYRNQTWGELRKSVMTHSRRPKTQLNPQTQPDLFAAKDSAHCLLPTSPNPAQLLTPVLRRIKPAHEGKLV